MKTIAIPLLRTENSIGAVGPIEILTKTCVLWRQLSDGKFPFAIHSFSAVHGEPAIARIQAFIAEHFKEKLMIEDVARRVGMSVRNFSRRFKDATGEAFSSYVQKFRVEQAKRLFEATNLSASEIMYQVGYNDERSFRRLFKEQTGLSPRH